MITSILITNSLWSASSYIGERVIVFHETEFVPSLPHPTIGVSGAWDWGAMIGLAMTQVTTEYVWIEHDDIAYDSEAVHLLLAGAQAKGAVLAFPNVDGPDASWQQKLDVKGISDCFSYSSDCAMLVRSDFLRECLRLGMKGKGFHAGYLQLCAREKLATTIVVHAAKVMHLYAQTWGDLPPDDVKRMISDSVKWAADTLHIRTDGWDRICEPAPVWHTDAEEHPQVEGNRVYFPLTMKTIYCDGNVLDTIANTCPSDRWILHNKKYSRYRLGDHYAVAGEPSTVTMTVQPNIGMGDVVFVCKAIRALKDSGMKVHATSQGGYGRLMAWCTDLESWAGAPSTPIDALEVGHIGNWGGDYVPSHICRHFGVEYKGQQAGIWVPEKEREEGEDALRIAGWKGGLLLVVVPHGGWISKRWKHTRSFVKQAIENGWQVWVPGKAWGNVVIDTPDFMKAVAILSKATILVGFDSGLSHVAASLGVGVVCLSGPTNAAGLIFDGQPENVVAIELRDPASGDCGPNSCRHQTGGARCPLRDNAPGADCIDEITTARVWNEVEWLMGKLKERGEINV